MSATANADSTADGITWHAVAVDDVVKRLATDIGKGLAANEAATRLQEYGPNRLPEGKRRGPFTRVLSQVKNNLVYVLLRAGLILDAGEALSSRHGNVSLSEKRKLTATFPPHLGPS